MSYDQPGDSGEPARTEALVGDLAGGGLFLLTVKASPADFEAGLSAVARTVTTSG